MELIQAVTKEQLGRVEALYLSAFPKGERKPFEIILQKREEGFVDVLALEESGEFAGLALTIKYGDLVLLDYFAVEESAREHGYGSKALKALFATYTGKRLMIEIESTKEEADNRIQRLRRKAFYERNGMVLLDFDVELFGIKMETMANQKDVSFEEYTELYLASYGSRVQGKIRRLNG